MVHKNVLADAIKFELAPICKLTKIYRQNENQAIAVIANDIRKGEVPAYKEDYEDFKFIDVSISNYYSQKNSISSNDFADLRGENSEYILNNILNISAGYIEKYYDFIRKRKSLEGGLTLFQVITPMKAGILGVDNLNIPVTKTF
ncbi:MAG: hypothetical protein U5K55_06575 [Aliarcobacter sp.]|nr:hypothetical protein [Aliarcobacter sp.]